MTRPNPAPEPAPEVVTEPQQRTSAGVPITVTVTITNRSSAPRQFVVTALGVDSSWLPAPSRSQTVAAGDSVQAHLTLRPAEGTLPARYPLAIAVQAVEPVSGQAPAATAVREIDLIVDAPGQINVILDPPDTTAVYSKKFFVQLQNAGLEAEQVHLDAHAPYSTAIDVSRGPFLVPPGSTVRVPARLTVARPSLFRRPIRHVYSITARTSGAPRYAEGSLTARSVIGPTGTKVIAVLSVIALWVAIALMAVPKLADTVRNHGNQAAGSSATATKTPGAGAGKHRSGGGSGGGSGSGPNGGGSGGGNGGSGGGNGGGSGGGASTNGAGSALKQKKVQLTGVVSGSAASGATVTLLPTTFGAPDTIGATPVGPQTADDAPIGKLTADALAAVEPAALSTAALAARSSRAMQTKTDGAYSFAGVPAVGFYILQFSKPGYQTQRFVIDPTSAAAVQPMKVALAPGTGSLHGVVNNAAGGKVGGATITITDGTNTLTTSTISKGSGIGTWSVRGLSTPSTYLVSASHDGLGVASRLVSVAAAGSRAVDLSMSSGVATLSGMVRWVDAANRNLGVGNVSVSATNGTVTRTASTVTTGPQTGRFVLPQLTVGTWTVNVSATGFQLQTARLRIKPGAPKSELNFELTPSTATVPGQVLTAGGKPLVAAGLTLSNTTDTYKLTSHGGGSFTFDNVAPGTYTLTAEYFGYNAASLTVKAVAGATPKQSVFHLGVHHVTNNSTIVGYASNAISSSGSFGCEPNVDNPVSGCIVYFQLLDSRNKIVPTTLVAGQPNQDRPEVTVDKIDGPVPFELSADLAEGDGLAPGQYKLVVSAPGFIPAKVTVHVPLNGTAALPEISLFPANELAGQLKATGDIDTPITSTDGKNCMLAVPVGFSSTQLDPKRFYCDQAQADAESTPASPAFGPDDVAPFAANCTFTGAPEPGVAVTTGNGVYDLRGLCDGQYKLYPIIGNSAYKKPDPDAAITQTFANGQTIEYDPQIDRLPIVHMTVKQLDDNGVAQPVVSGDLSLVCGATASNATTDTNGLADFYGVPDGTQTCVLQFGKFTTPLGSIGRALNQIYPENATFTNKPLSLVGRIVSQYDTSDSNPVGGVTVHITALTGFIGAAPQYTTATATTNDNGCYAIVPTFESIDAHSATADLDCGTLGRANEAAVDPTTPLAATEPNATITVDSGLRTKALTPAATVALTKMTVHDGDATVTPFIDKLTALSTQPVPAQTVDLTGLSFLPATPSGTPITPDPTTNNLTFSGAVITITADSAHGSGTITAGVTSSGQLTWLDSAIGVPNRAWQGTYTYTLTVPGYQSKVDNTITCGPNGNQLSCVLGDRNVVALGGLSGTVTALPGNAAVAGARVYLSPCNGSGCTVPPESSACPVPSSGYSAITGSSGGYDFSKNGQRQIVPGDYQLMVCADGKITYYVDETVAGGANPAANISMTQLGQISGKLTGNGVPLSQVNVSLDQCDASGTACTTRMATATTAADGTFTFADPLIGSHFLDPGHSYKITASPVGYRSGSALVDVVYGGTGYPDYNKSLDLAALAGFSGTVTDAISGRAIPGATVKITCDSVDLAGGSCPATDPAPVSTDSNGRFAFTGAISNFKYFMEPGHWSVVISAPGYADNDLGSIQLNGGDNVYNGLTLQLLGAVSGTVIDAVSNAAVVGARVHATCADTAAVCGALSPGSIPDDVVTTGTGAFQFGTAGDRNVFPLVKWALTISAAGYEDGGTPTGTPIDVRSGDNSLTPAFSLSPLGTLSGTLTGGSTTLNESRALNQTLVDVQQCASTVPAGSATCPTTGPQLHATTDPSGNYTISGPNSTGVLQPGQWQISTASTGFLPGSKVVTIVSGPNTNGNLLLQYSMVDVTVQVEISGSSTMTKHARLTFTRADGKTFLNSAGTTVSSLTVGPSSGSNPPSYLATNLVPTAYTVAISGDGTNLGNSIPLQYATVNVPLVDAVTDPDGTTHNGQAPATVILPITLISSNTLKGTVTGDYGNSTSRKQAGIEVVLHEVGPGNPIATDLADAQLRTTTDSNGNYTLGGIPNGVYTISFNTPESGEATPDNGFQGSTSSQYSLSNNVTQQADALLEPVRQTVQVTVTKSADDDLSTYPAPKVAAIGDGHGNPLQWGPLSPNAVSGDSTGSTTATYTFANVPAGCWNFDLGASNTTHTGHLNLDSGGGSCSTGFEVSGLQSPATDATPGYSITEHVLTIAHTITPNATSDNGSTATFTLKVKSGTTTVFTDPSVSSGSSSTTLYLVPGTYSVDLSLNAPSVWWSRTPTWSYTADLTTDSDTAAAVSAAETPPATLTINTYSSSKLDASHTLKVTAVCEDAQDLPAGCGTGTTANDSGAGVVFSGLAPGGWKITISGKTNDNKTVNEPALTVTMSGVDQTVSWP